LKTIDLGFKQRYRSRREPETFKSSRKAMVAITQQAIRVVGICHSYTERAGGQSEFAALYSVKGGRPLSARFQRFRRRFSLETDGKR
jgi:hypothetical protein